MSRRAAWERRLRPLPIDEPIHLTAVRMEAHQPRSASGWLVFRWAEDGPGGSWHIEHTRPGLGEGRWGSCDLGLPGEAARRVVEQAARRHLLYKPHTMDLPILIGLHGDPHCHAGGGEKWGSPPRWIHLPREDDQ